MEVVAEEPRTNPEASEGGNHGVRYVRTRDEFRPFASVEGDPR